MNNEQRTARFFLFSNDFNCAIKTTEKIEISQQKPFKIGFLLKRFRWVFFFLLSFFTSWYWSKIASIVVTEYAKIQIKTMCKTTVAMCTLFGVNCSANILKHIQFNMGVVDFLHYFLLYFPHRFLFYFKHCHLLNASCCFFFSLFFFLFRFTLNLSQEKNSALRCLEFFNINSHTNTKLINHNLWTHSL